MTGDVVHALPGMPDVAGEAYTRMRRVSDALGDSLELRGYRPIDTPIVENAELFARKSGGELSGMLYAFEDPGGNRVSLRAEFTPAVIRRYVERGGDSSGAARWRYCGPVFRYHALNGGGGGDLRQFTQVGAELIGPSGSDADAEVISAARDALAAVGLMRPLIRVGDIGLLNRALRSFGLSERTRAFALRRLDDLRGGEGDIPHLVSVAGAMGLVRSREAPDPDGGGRSEGGQAERRLVREMLSDAVASPVGRRSPEQIIERMTRKLRQRDDPRSLAAALALVDDLRAVRGSPEAALPAARDVFRRRGADTALADGLADVLQALSRRGVPADEVEVDLSYVPGISYYTGIVFEASCEVEGRRVSVGGGGRYDGLVKGLGGSEDAPAMGFALRLDRIIGAMDAQGAFAEGAPC